MRVHLTVLALLACLQLGLARTAQAHDDAAGHEPDGAVVHLEIPATDLAASAAFYGGLFGWETTPMMDGYSTFTSPGGFGGGFTSFAPVAANGGVVLYIYCADIDSKLPEIEAAGGATVEGRSPIPGVGWYALFKDCAGNVIGLFSAEGVPGGELPPAAGAAQ
jgi:predicted enzyme related to lactoylglutathione lyase